MTPRGRWPTVWLAIRSFAWTLLIPGLFAGYLPWRYFGLRDVQLNLHNPAHLLGLLGIGLGVVLLGACIWEFARSGRGTLAPVDPPRELVVRGLYRYVRNPMYLSVTLIVWGELLLTGVTRVAGVLDDLVPGSEPLRHRLRGALPASTLRGGV